MSLVFGTFVYPIYKVMMLESKRIEDRLITSILVIFCKLSQLKIQVQQFNHFYYSKAMYPEKYSLTWHTYSDHLKSLMKELMMNEDFSDVTLVTEDKKHIKANINILSTCSPVFKDILKKEKNSNQIMYL